MDAQRADKTDITTIVVKYNSAYLELLSDKYGGDSTVNELRVANCIVRAYFFGQDVGVSSIADELLIPKSTVSRTVSKLEKKGWVNQECSSEDGRRRNVRMTEKSVRRIEEEKQFLVQWLNSILQESTRDVPSVKLLLELHRCNDE